MIQVGEIHREEFQKHIVAQDDDNDYSEGGWLAYVDGDFAALARYGHCSCFTTFTSLCGGGISDSYESGSPAWDWTGTPDELVLMATKLLDPNMPERTANPDDYDYDHLMRVYDKVILWSLDR